MSYCETHLFFEQQTYIDILQNLYINLSTSEIKYPTDQGRAIYDWVTCDNGILVNSRRKELLEKATYSLLVCLKCVVDSIELEEENNIKQEVINGLNKFHSKFSRLKKDLDHFLIYINKRYLIKEFNIDDMIMNKTSKPNRGIDPIEPCENSYQETRIKLKQILDSTVSTEHHTNIIINLPTLKDAHIYCKMYNFTGQFMGPVIEQFIKIKYNMTKNKASMCNGDLKSGEKNIEIKVSNGGKDNNKFNYVQLRINHTCEYILTAYYINYDNLDNLGELFIFRLNKNNLKDIIFKFGSYAHGTVRELGLITMEDLNDTTNQKEYSIRPKYGDRCWNELLPFRIDESSI
jgi:hypothetical protein